MRAQSAAPGEAVAATPGSSGEHGNGRILPPIATDLKPVFDVASWYRARGMRREAARLLIQWLADQKRMPK